MMKYSNIIYNDLVNTDGLSLTFFTQGCPHHCKGCFSKQTWGFDGGHELTNDVLEQLEYVISNYNYDYLCLIGGEPLSNIVVCSTILSLFGKLNKDVKVWVYTGYDMDEIETDKVKNGFLQFVDVIVTGRFEENRYDAKLKYRGSSNQKIWKKSESGEWIDTTNL